MGKVRAWLGALGGLCAMAMLALAAIGPARAQEVSLTGLRYDFGVVTMAIPRLTAIGTPHDEAALRAILAQDAAGDPVERLARLQAREIVIPELTMTLTVDGLTDTSVYRDIRLSDIRAGVIGRLLIARSEGEHNDKTAGRSTFTVGETTVEGIDLPQHARVLTGVAAGPDEPLRPLWRSFAYRDYITVLPGNTGRIEVARISGRETRARPGKARLADTFAALMALPDRSASDADSDASAGDLAVLARMLRVFEDFRFGVVDVEGLRGRTVTEGVEATFAIARMRLSDEASAPGTAMSDVRIEAGPMKLALAEFEMRDFDFSSSISKALDLLERGDLDAFMTEWPTLIPKLGTIRIAGLQVEGPDTQTRPRNNQPPEILRASVKSLELSVLAQTEGVPTAIRFIGEEVRAPLPATSRDANVRALRAAGLRDLDISWRADVAWRPDTSQLAIEALELGGRDLARIAFSGLLNNVTKSAFSTDPAEMQVAWLSATASRLTLSVRDAGGFNLLLANEARKARKTPDALRREWGTAAAVGLPALLGDSDGAKALTGAISRFLARPGALDIDIRARDSAGIGAADVIAAMGQPRALFNKLEVQASAQ